MLPQQQPLPHWVLASGLQIRDLDTTEAQLITRTRSLESHIRMGLREVRTTRQRQSRSSRHHRNSSGSTQPTIHLRMRSGISSSRNLHHSLNMDRCSLTSNHPLPSCRHTKLHNLLCPKSMYHSRLCPPNHRNISSHLDLQLPSRSRLPRSGNRHLLPIHKGLDAESVSTISTSLLCLVRVTLVR